MENPITTQRKQLGLTQDKLANAAGITRQVVVLTEEGLYNTVPASLVEALGVDLQEEYREWQRGKRYEHRELFQNLYVVSWDDLKNTVTERMGAVGSFSAFCRALVYQKSLVKDFERFGRGAAGIFGALKECGLSDDVRRELWMT